MQSCPRCGAELEADAGHCEECGHRLAFPGGVAPAGPIRAPGAPRLIAGLGCGMLAVMLALVSLVALFGLIMGGLLGVAAAR